MDSEISKIGEMNISSEMNWKTMDWWNEYENENKKDL